MDNLTENQIAFYVFMTHQGHQCSREVVESLFGADVVIQAFTDDWVTEVSLEYPGRRWEAIPMLRVTDKAKYDWSRFYAKQTLKSIEFVNSQPK